MLSYSAHTQRLGARGQADLLLGYMTRQVGMPSIRSGASASAPAPIEVNPIARGELGELGDTFAASDDFRTAFRWNTIFRWEALQG